MHDVTPSSPVRPSIAEDPFVRLDATAQAELVRRGEITAVELLEAAIARVEALDGALNAVPIRCFDAARRQARSAPPTGPFAGVPFLIKDLTAWAGAPVTFGSRFFRRMRARRSEDVVLRMQAAGLVPFGKTNTAEFGLLGSTEPLLFGPTRNPWDLERSPGGSSGGAAAAVAAGFAPIAHGGDGGGSIRIPASNCALFGLKPSRDRCVGSVRASPGDLSVQFCLSRSVRDSARMMQVMELSGGEAPYPEVGFVAGPSPRRLRIAVAELSILGARPEPEVAAALERAARLCSDLGHHVEPADPPVAGEEAAARFVTLWAATPAAILRNIWLLRLRMLQTRRLDKLFEPWTLGLAELHRREEEKEAGAAARSVAYFQRMAQRFDDFFERYDVLLTPVLRRPPVRIGEQAPSTPFETLLERSIDTICYTPLQNALGAPAMSIPTAWTEGGLPIGVQYAARPGAERMLFELAYEIEAAAPWADRWPPYSAVSSPFMR